MARLKDARQFGFCIVDNRVIDHYGPILGGTALAVYLCLVRHAGRDRETWPSYREMMRELQFSKRKISFAVSQLVTNGLISVTRKVGKRQAYHVTDFREGEPVPCAPPVKHPCAPGETVAGLFDAPPVEHCAPPVKHPCAPGETVELSAPLVIEQSPATATPENAAAAGKDDNSESRTLLLSAGVLPRLAEEFSQRTPPILLKQVVEYWQHGAGSVKLPGVGLLVEILRSPQSYGFIEINGVWDGPKPHAGFKSRCPPPEKTAPTVGDRLDRICRERIANGQCPACGGGPKATRLCYCNRG